MLLELCLTIPELNQELQRRTDGSLKGKYSYLAEYMKLLGSTDNRKETLKERYAILQGSFLIGDYRTINGENRANAA